MSEHVFKGIAVATNVESIAAVALGRWLAEGRAVASERGVDGLWTHKIVEVAR